MKQFSWIISLLLIAGFAGQNAATAAEGSLEATLRAVMEKQTAAYDNEDKAATLRYIHTKSPEYGSMEQALPGQFKAMDVRAEVVDFRYIGHDDEFAVARVKVKTAAESGTEFADNIVDSLVVFHQEDGEWKFWSDEILGVVLIQ